MYCQFCGKQVNDDADFCINCGRQLNGRPAAAKTVAENDSSSFGFALLGFLIPLVGLILYFVYDDKRPKRAKSVGKGALVGVITQVVLAVAVFVASIVFTVSVFDAAIDESTDTIPFFGKRIEQMIENMEKQGREYSDVALGEFKVSTVNDGVVTGLDVTLKNESDDWHSFRVDIEAIGADGVRLGTDYVIFEDVGGGQTARETAFAYIEPVQIENFKDATFNITGIRLID